MLQTKKSMIEKKGTMTWKQTESREAKRSIPPTGAKTKSNKHPVIVIAIKEQNLIKKKILLTLMNLLKYLPISEIRKIKVETKIKKLEIMVK